MRDESKGKDGYTIGDDVVKTAATKVLSYVTTINDDPWKDMKLLLKESKNEKLMYVCMQFAFF